MRTMHMWQTAVESPASMCSECVANITRTAHVRSIAFMRSLWLVIPTITTSLHALAIHTRLPGPQQILVGTYRRRRLPIVQDADLPGSPPAYTIAQQATKRNLMCCPWDRSAHQTLTLFMHCFKTDRKPHILPIRMSIRMQTCPLNTHTSDFFFFHF